MRRFRVVKSEFVPDFCNEGGGGFVERVKEYLGF